MLALWLVLRSAYYASIMPGAKECLYASISSLAPARYMFVFFTSKEKWCFFL